MFQAETHEPSVWTIRVMEFNGTGNSPMYFSMTKVVVEPKVDIHVAPTALEINCLHQQEVENMLISLIVGNRARNFSRR